MLQACRFLCCGFLRRVVLRRLLRAVLGSLWLRLCVCHSVLQLRKVLRRSSFLFQRRFLSSLASGTIMPMVVLSLWRSCFFFLLCFFCFVFVSFYLLLLHLLYAELLFSTHYFHLADYFVLNTRLAGLFQPYVCSFHSLIGTPSFFSTSARWMEFMVQNGIMRPSGTA